MCDKGYCFKCLWTSADGCGCPLTVCAGSQDGSCPRFRPHACKLAAAWGHPSSPIGLSCKASPWWGSLFRASHDVSMPTRYTVITNPAPTQTLVHGVVLCKSNRPLGWVGACVHAHHTHPAYRPGMGLPHTRLWLKMHSTTNLCTLSVTCWDI